jgi:hypothetical protein
MLAGAGPALAGKKAMVQVGFVGVPPVDPKTGKPAFQNVLLNVQSVRLNPKANAGPGSGQWQNIPTPPGIGGTGQSAELQIDLNSSQNIPQMFNTANVKNNTYRVAQILIDPNNPGTLIPNCPQAPPISPNADGCINYPITVPNGSFISVVNTGAGGLLGPPNGLLSTLVLQVTMKIIQAPTGPGGAYAVSITLAQPSNPLIGNIIGTVSPTTGTGTPSNGRTRKLAVTAETIGTGTVIATAPVQNNKFTLTLPAAADFGTLYDLALAGGADTYGAVRLPPLFSTGTLMPSFAPTTNQTLGTITGTITDGCVANKPIIGATLNLLIPPDNSNAAPTFCLDFPEQCIVVATANTDSAGNFPLPGTIQIPAAFDNVPTRKQTNPYTIEITQPGYDPLRVLAVPSSNTAKAGGMCSIDRGTTFAACSLTLSTAYITGQIPIIQPPPGQTTLVQVFAEDHGSNNIESSLPMPVAVTSTNNGFVGYTINVPPSVAIFDLFATTIDLYQGVVDPFQGHTIVPISGIPAPAACATTTARTPSETIECVGHGSITGTVANPNLGTSVVLEKLDPEGPLNDNEVQITSSIVQNQLPNPTSSNNYAFCAPADTYQVQRFQLPTPTPTPSAVPSAAPSPEAAGDPVSVTIPPAPLINPSAIPTPGLKCPTTCSTDGMCPGLCNNAVVPIP